MNTKKIEIEIPEGKKAEWVNGVLTLVDDKPKDITDRIKTFEDACKWCCLNGYAHMALEYERVMDRGPISSEDVLAYLKLRIITCALNEGWEPTEDNHRYTDYYDELTGKVIVSGIDGFYCDSSIKLCFKSAELAEYAANQFRDIYADFCGCKKGGEK